MRFLWSMTSNDVVNLLFAKLFGYFDLIFMKRFGRYWRICVLRTQPFRRHNFRISMLPAKILDHQEFALDHLSNWKVAPFESIYQSTIRSGDGLWGYGVFWFAIIRCVCLPWYPHTTSHMPPDRWTVRTLRFPCLRYRWDWPHCQPAANGPGWKGTSTLFANCKAERKNAKNNNNKDVLIVWWRVTDKIFATGFWHLRWA